MEKMENDDSHPLNSHSSEVLLIEDNPGDVQLLEEALADASLDSVIHIANDGTQAINFLTTRAEDETKANVDLVLLDLGLPGKSGFDVLQTIKDDPRLRRIPVIVLTTSSLPEDVAKSYDLMANAFLTKPSTFAELADLGQAIRSFWLSSAALSKNR